MGYIALLYLEENLSKYYLYFSQDIELMKNLFKAFSFPGSLGSHYTPELPRTIQEKMKKQKLVYLPHYSTPTNS